MVVLQQVWWTSVTLMWTAGCWASVSIPIYGWCGWLSLARRELDFLFVFRRVLVFFVPFLSLLVVVVASMRASTYSYVQMYIYAVAIAICGMLYCCTAILLHCYTATLPDVQSTTHMCTHYSCYLLLRLLLSGRNTICILYWQADKYSYYHYHSTMYSYTASQLPVTTYYSA